LTEERRRVQEQYWETQHQGMMLRLKPLVWDEWLDRDEVLRTRSGFTVGAMLLDSAVSLFIVDEDDLAKQFMATAAFYFEHVMNRDDPAGEDAFQEAIRSERLLAFAQWLLGLTQDVSAIRRGLVRSWARNEQIFSSPSWRDLQLNLAAWMAEHIVIGEFAEALRVHAKYAGTGGRPEPFALRAESALLAAADELSNGAPKGAAVMLEEVYREVTNWGAPGFRSSALRGVDRFLYAYVRGRYFKGEGDPIRVIKRMRFSE
jgi:hypothetical protein